MSFFKDIFSVFEGRLLIEYSKMGNQLLTTEPKHKISLYYLFEISNSMSDSSFGLLKNGEWLESI